MDVFEAAERGDLERIRALIEQDAGLVRAQQEGQDRKLPLFIAAEEGHLEVARYLLDHGAPIDHGCYGRWSPLYGACSEGHAPLVLLLLQRGADVNYLTHADETPLMFAETDAIARMLLEHGAIVDAAEIFGSTPCHCACHDGRAGVLRQLLEAGAEPAFLDHYRCTPMDVAIEHGHQDCVAILQEWHRAYLLRTVRHMRDASSTASGSAL